MAVLVPLIAGEAVDLFAWAMGLAAGEYDPRLPYREGTTGSEGGDTPALLEALVFSPDRSTLESPDWPLSPLYLEAGRRVDRVMADAAACGLPDESRQAVDVMRRQMFALINHGIFETADGPIGDRAERPTQGQVSAALTRFAAEVAKLCKRQLSQALVADLGQPLSVPAASGRPWWAIVTGLALVGLAAYAWHVRAGKRGRK